MDDQKKPKKPKHNPKPTAAASDLSFKPSADVKGLRFGGQQFIVKSFTIRRSKPHELSHLINLPSYSNNDDDTKNPNPTIDQSPLPLASTSAYIPTNFTILAHRAWHTLTLGLGTKKSKIVVFVFESVQLKSQVEKAWPTEIQLGEVNKKMVRGIKGCELARFKFRKGCVTFYVYAVRRLGNLGFGNVEDLRCVLECVVALKDFVDHTALLALPEQRSIGYAPPMAVAH